MVENTAAMRACSKLLDSKDPLLGSPHMLEIMAATVHWMAVPKYQLIPLLMLRGNMADLGQHPLPKGYKSTHLDWMHFIMLCRNRHFRLIWSSKGGKKATLMPTSHDSEGQSFSARPLESQFLESLVTLVEPTCNLLTVGHFLWLHSWGLHNV